MNHNQGKIQVLDILTANQIAAGEVVERPMSVVKELVENAIDAGASHITVKIWDGGLEAIQIVDDGEGMVPQDMETAFLRHATSKIRQTEDIEHIRTLGFRGEALPSIAAVSKVTVKSRPQTATAGWHIEVEEGDVSHIGEAGMPAGTIITVKNLFYNTPARKKFIKKPSAESGLVGELLSRMILARPDIAFVLQEEGRTVLHSPGTGSLEHSIMAVYGRDVLSQMLPIPENPFLFGLVSRPGIHRASRNYYNFFINGRWVKSKELAHAVDTAYNTLNPDRRYAIVALHLTLPAESIDVNVHPAKLEVRFREWDKLRQEILALLTAAILGKNGTVTNLTKEPAPVSYPLPDEEEGIRLQEKKRLNEKQAIFSDMGKDDAILHFSPKPPAIMPSMEAKTEHVTEFPSIETETETANRNDQINPTEEQSRLFSKDFFANPDLVTRNAMNVVDSGSKDLEGSEIRNPEDQDIKDEDESEDTEDTKDIQESEKILPETTQTAFGKEEPFWLSLRPLGQLNGTYIVAAEKDALYLIDQHAAHERIRFEVLKQNFLTKQAQIVQLVLPTKLELTHKQKKTLIAYLNEMTSIGFLVEYFGDNDFILRGVPAWYDQGSCEELFFALLDTIGDEEHFDFAEFCREALFSLACHSAIRGNEYVNDSDIGWLFRQLHEAKSALTCPHGRPIAVKISLEEINRRFLRS